MVPGKIILLGALALAGAGMCVAQEKPAEAKPEVKKVPIRHTSPASGKEMYESYCAACHGQDGKGNGPAAPAMKVAPSDLTTLSKRHDGKFPSSYLSGVLRFGTDVTAHGSADMPVWGTLFRSLDKYHDAMVQLRISNLLNYIESIQAK
jgi:mono/diheme cytochrome c family protein